MHPHNYNYNHNYHKFYRNYSRHCRRSMLGRLFFFGVGVYTGVVLNQGYKVPKAPLPSEIWGRVKDLAKEKKVDIKPEDKEKLDDIVDKLKQLEQKYRRND